MRTIKSLFASVAVVLCLLVMAYFVYPGVCASFPAFGNHARIGAFCPTASATQNPLQTSGPTLTVNVATDRHAIDPNIYGISFADEELAAAINLPVRRWGGDAATRYNWQNDTYNTASEGFFANIPYENPNPAALPDGSAADRFVEQNLRTGTETVLTLPMIGWAPKSRAEACGFSVAKYGAQESVSPQHPDCGNGVDANGDPITGNDPGDTSVASDPAFVQSWIEHLTEQFGSADAGGVAYYNLDNEPMIWNYAHRDVHPEPLGYDGLRDLTYAYAAALKQSDPAAQTLGPTTWGWTAYFYSALDEVPGESWWLNPQDRNAHGGAPLTAWYLQQMQAYEQQHGVRILDYLDLHYYPQSPGVTLAPAGDAATQALRLRSTRALWDPTYVDESWIGEPVWLIPRMREWVDQNYPGTKLAISEYNWGALDHINGALAQADVLGIFGREGVDLATLWEPGSADQPFAYAFRMFRDYDDAGNTFGDVSVEASSTDQDQLAVYAAQRSSDGALTVMVINKSGSPLASTLEIAGFSAESSVQVYTYSAADLHSIVAAEGDPLAGTSLTHTFPAASITLLVLPSVSGNGAPTPTPSPTPSPTEEPSPTVTPTPKPGTGTLPDTGSISGSLFVDANGNQQFDAGEEPLAGALVTLLNEDRTTQITAPIFTGGDGSFSFGELSLGEYVLTFELPAGYTSDESLAVPVTVGSAADISLPAIPVQRASAKVFLPLVNK